MTDYTIGTTVFGDWVIREELGSGAFGRVYRIEKSEYGITTQAALKVIRIPQSQSDLRDIQMDSMDERSVTSYFQGMVNTLVREIAVMSSLKSHPNIVAYENHKVEAHPGTVGWDILIQMELLTPLRDYQLRHPMAEADVHRLAVDICSALVFCQKKSLIHRDIKPQNIFVSEAGQFKLGDFGVARALDKTVGSLSKQGTEDYMAPEVYRGEKYGVSADIYSLGLVLYRLMNAGRLPFLPPAPQPIGFSDRLNALSDRIAGEKPLEPPCNASPEFAQIILKVCAHDPGQRYQTAAALLAALEALHSETGPAEPVDFGSTEDPEDGGTASPFGRQKPTGSTDDWEEKTTGPFRKPVEDAPPAGEPADKPAGKSKSPTKDKEDAVPPKKKHHIGWIIGVALLVLGLIYLPTITGWVVAVLGGVFLLVMLCFAGFMISISIPKKKSKQKPKQKPQAKGIYRYAKCPECGRRIRVPIGEGQIVVHCPQCLHVFSTTT